jgi:mRNA-degrading endonuclease HigB of HigAB toxin-antitoxin module
VVCTVEHLPLLTQRIIITGRFFYNHFSNLFVNKYILRSCDHATRQIFTIKPTRCTNFSNLFLNENLQVSDSFSVHHQEFFTVHSAVVYVIQVYRQLSCSRIRMFHPDPARELSVWHTTLLSAQWKTPDDGQRNCPKHVDFHSKMKFEKLVHLVGNTIRKYILALSVATLRTRYLFCGQQLAKYKLDGGKHACGPQYKPLRRYCPSLRGINSYWR